MSPKKNTSKPASEKKKVERLDPFHVARHLLRSLAPSLETHNRVEGLIRRRDIPSLCQIGQITDKEYQSSELYDLLVERQVASLFKKNEAFVDMRRCTETARANFDRAEKLCRIANKRLDHFYMHPDRLDPELRLWLTRMEKDIEELLPRDTDVFVQKLPELVRLTNGATEDRTRPRSLPFLKITGRIKAPAAALQLLAGLLLFFGVDLGSLKYQATSRNVIMLVLKNWATFRTIAKEATHVLPIQLAFDSFGKKLLLRWGIDLRKQTRNQELARLGSIDGSYATVDLEMASDSLCINAVAWCFPAPWFELLSSLRASEYSAPWGNGTYAKFSSMGNGFTFTLETLIFTAACRALGSRDHAVYGDDICIRSEYAPSLVRLLAFLGFKVNGAKSFLAPNTRFRESCGCDYYKGNLVTPFYLRENPRVTDKSAICHVINGLVAVSPPNTPIREWCVNVINKQRLRLVPWSEDSRSGVFVTPQFAREIGELSVSKAQTIGKDKRPNPLLGFEVFRGYVPYIKRRRTRGRRSYFLWFLQKNRGPDERRALASSSVRESLADLIKHDEIVASVDGVLAIRTSETAVAAVYGHGLLQYRPKPLLTPAYCFAWSDRLGRERRNRRPRKRK